MYTFFLNYIAYKLSSPRTKHLWF